VKLVGWRRRRRRMATLEDEIVELKREIAELKRGIAGYEEDLRQAKKNRKEKMILSTQGLITAKSYELTELRKQQQQQQTSKSL
jgi:multidrug resistance efflux pump